MLGFSFSHEFFQDLLARFFLLAQPRSLMKIRFSRRQRRNEDYAENVRDINRELDANKRSQLREHRGAKADKIAGNQFGRYSSKKVEGTGGRYLEPRFVRFLEV